VQKTSKNQKAEFQALVNRDFALSSLIICAFFVGLCVPKKDCQTDKEKGEAAILLSIMFYNQLKEQGYEIKNIKEVN